MRLRTELNAPPALGRRLTQVCALSRRQYREYRFTLRLVSRITAHPGVSGAVDRAARALADLCSRGVLSYATVTLAINTERERGRWFYKLLGPEGRLLRPVIHEELILLKRGLQALLGLKAPFPSAEYSRGASRSFLHEAYIDASVRGHHAAAGVRLMTVGQNEPLVEVSCAVLAGASIAAELRAAELALRTAHALGVRSLKIFTDSAAVVDAFAGHCPRGAELEMAAVGAWQGRFEALSVVGFPRAFNMASDSLARKALL